MISEWAKWWEAHKPKPPEKKPKPEKPTKAKSGITKGGMFPTINSLDKCNLGVFNGARRFIDFLLAQDRDYELTVGQLEYLQLLAHKYRKQIDGPVTAESRGRYL